MGFDVRHGGGQYPPVSPEAPPRRVAIAAARNEADRVGDTLDALARALPGAQLWVADDASQDGTAEAAMRHGAQVVSRKRPHGKGGNMTAAAEAALSELESEATVLVCDADLGASAKALPALVEAVEAGECDLAVAAFARREGGGFGVALGYARRKIEDLCGFRAEAPISGQRAMRSEVLREVLPFAADFGMEVGMTVDAVRAGYRVKEIELPLEHRATGRTLGGFLHRARQLRDFRRAVRARR
ncbi:MAG: glycosyltransferase [Actinobacteria bacterium]|nr:glycosyltransferase [Actinomycetota bacterium]